MATTTPNYGLTKPDLSELYDIGVQNTNMDLIDTQMKQNADGIYDLYYHAGDTIALNDNTFAGTIYSDKKNVYFFIPLNKPLASDVATVAIGGNWIVRHADGINIINNVTLDSVGTVQLFRRQLGIAVRVTLTTATTAAGLSVVTAYGNTGATLTFS